MTFLNPDGQGNYTLDGDTTPDLTSLDGLRSLLSNLPNYSLLNDDMLNTALLAARMPDSAGVWPGQVGYVPTYDIYFAATRLVGFLRAQPVVRQSSSEGTSVAVDAPQWGGLLDYYASMSPIMAAQGGGVLRLVHIPDEPHVYPADMSGRYDDNDNVDTDLG